MSLAVILSIGIILSIVFHFIGVYVNAQKTVWAAIILLWAAAISFATNEIKPKGYEYIKSIEGKYADTDRLIQEAKPTISLYEMLTIKKSVSQHKKNN